MTERACTYNNDVDLIGRAVVRTAEKAKSIERAATENSIHPEPLPMWTNRGRTAAGVTVTWESVGPNIDNLGAQYPYTVPPWGDIVEVVGLRTWQE